MVRNRIDITHDVSIAEAAAASRGFAAILGLGNTMQYMVATAVSELATNIRRYAGQGFVTIKEVNKGGKKGIEVIAKDSGPGIADIEAAMQDNFSTFGSLGVGLPGTKRMMDEFEIESEPGKGTRVTIRKWL